RTRRDLWEAASGGISGLLEAQADAVLFPAVNQLQVLQLLLLQRKVQQSGHRLRRLLLRQHLAVENLLQRAVLVGTLLHGRLHPAGIRTAAAADSAPAHPDR